MTCIGARSGCNALICITIPGELRGKGRPRFTARGGFARAFTDAKTVNAEAWVKACAVEAGAVPLDGPVSIAMQITVAVPASWSKRKRADALAGGLYPTGKPDLDNCVKLVADALNGVAWRDDKQIVRMDCRKAFGPVAQTILTICEV